MSINARPPANACPALNVRPAAPADLPFIVDAQAAMALESEGMTLERGALEEGVRAVLEKRVDAEYLLAEEDGLPVGMLMTVSEWSDWRNGAVVWVHSVYVVPESRRRGVFTALYASVRARVEASPGLLGVRLYVHQRNEPAQRVYDALGMRRDRYHLYEWMQNED